MKSRRKIKREKLTLNLAELRKLYLKFGLEVLEFNARHFRIIGRNIVDYWPSTGRAWIVGSSEPATVMSPAEVCGLALLESS